MRIKQAIKEAKNDIRFTNVEGFWKEDKFFIRQKNGISIEKARLYSIEIIEDITNERLKLL